MEHAVMALAGAFVLAFLVYKMICEKCIFFWYSNFKYKFLDSCSADFIYYGKDIGVDVSLKLDKPSPAIYTRRLQGQAYLKSKLEYQAADASKGSSVTEGEQLAPKIVDCRFALHKVIMPLLRELEFQRHGSKLH